MSTPAPPRPREGGGSFFTWMAALTSLVGLAGSLYLSGMELKYQDHDLSFGMGLRACQLCFYQRSFMMAVVGVLCIGLLVRATRPGLLAALALPAAVAGLAVAGQHANLEYTGRLECPPGVHDFGEWGQYDLGSAPQQSLAVFGILVAFLLLDILTSGANLFISVLAVALGLLLAVAGIKTSPASMVPDPDKLDMCRKPAPPPAEAPAAP